MTAETIPLLLEGTGKIYDFPVGETEGLVGNGYRAPTEEELSSYDRRVAYEQNTTELERQAIGAGVGATTQLLGIPALAAKFTGIDENASGGAWLAQFASQMGGIPIEQAEEALRAVAEAGELGHIGGQIGASIFSTAALGAGAGALATKAGLNVGSKLALGATATESAAQHVTMLNEQAFVDNRDLSAETILAASILGGIGPLAMGPGLSALGKAGRKGLGKIDDARLARFEATMAKSDEALAQGIATSKAGTGKEMARLEVARNKAAAKLEKAEKSVPTYGGDVTYNAKKAAVDEARAALEAADEALRIGVVPAPVGPFQMTTKSPVRLADLLSPNRKSRFEALAGAADELGGAAQLAQSAFNRAGNEVGNVVGKAAQRAYREPWARGVGIGRGGGSAGAILGAISMDGLLGVAVGGAAGLAVQKFGPRAAGWVLGNVATGMRSLANEAANAALKGTAKAIAPKDILMRTASAGGMSYRTHLLSMIDDSRETVKAAGANPEAFVASIGETYGDLDPDMVRSITDSHLRAIQYLQKSIPPQPRLNPTMPQMGRANVPLRHAESYARKLRAVTDPMTLLQDLSDGTLHEDTVEAVRSVYPSMYLEIEAQALSALADLDQVVTRRQAVALDKLFQNGGLVYPPRDPGFQARLAVIAETQRQAAGGHDSAPMKPGRPKGSPTLGQSMRTSSQRISATMGN